MWCMARHIRARPGGTVQVSARLLKGFTAQNGTGGSTPPLSTQGGSRFGTPWRVEVWRGSARRGKGFNSRWVARVVQLHTERPGPGVAWRVKSRRVVACLGAARRIKARDLPNTQLGETR